MLAKQRRFAILIIFIVAAVLTPSPDVISQVLMAVPLLILYEASIILTKFAKNKKAPSEETAEQEGADFS
jgi:sec-independent protein translocase protein TatC